ncbi:MAG: helix-turn-helix transcriptional regulator [Deltaproteobacteria bacterium]|nr:helix-turn-helix transcriptional regulator [Deltaproteobacteria bacterium]
MRKVVKTSSENILVEMTPQEWKQIDTLCGLPENLACVMVDCKRRHGLTQADLAERMGISRTNLQQIERGHVFNMRLRTYERIIKTIS